MEGSLLLFGPWAPFHLFLPGTWAVGKWDDWVAGQIQSTYSHISKAEQPSTPDADISDPDPTHIFQLHVDDWVNNSQVSLHTGQEMKEGCSIEKAGTSMDSYHHHLWKISICSTIEADTPQNPEEIHGSHVVGEDVRVTCCFKGALPQPSLVTQIEDEDGERQAKMPLTTTPARLM